MDDTSTMLKVDRWVNPSWLKMAGESAIQVYDGGNLFPRGVREGGRAL
jgi:hypothetical protein